MRRALSVLVAFAIVGVVAPAPALAQVPPSGPPSQGGRSGHCPLNRLLEQLNLSADQKEKIRTIEQTDRGRQRRDAVLKVLTPEQRAQLQALEQQCR